LFVNKESWISRKIILSKNLVDKSQSDLYNEKVATEVGY